MGIILGVERNRLWKDPTNFKEYTGTWGIITGASRGIGKYYALGLAERGMNVCMIARNEKEMKEITTEIEEKYENVKTKIVIADFHNPKVYEETIEHEIIDDILKKRKEKIGMLINNVGGMQFDLPMGKFLDFTAKEETEIWNLNIKTTIRMIRIILPILLAQKSGRILNVSSLSSFFPQYMIPYATCKTRINAITESLCIEYPKSETNVVIKGHIVGEVANLGLLGQQFTSRLGVPHPEVFVKSSIDNFDIFPSCPLVAPYYQHAFQWWVMSFLPIWLRNFLLKKFVFPKPLERQ